MTFPASHSDRTRRFVPGVGMMLGAVASCAGLAARTTLAATVPPITVPLGYVQLVDDTGEITVAVPATWTNVDTAPAERNDDTPRPFIVASTNVERFRETFDAPGVALVGEPFVADTATYVGWFGVTVDCRNEVIESFDNGELTGHIGHWTACGSGAAEVHVVAASPADHSRTILLEVQITGPREEDALEVALATFGLAAS